MKITEVASGQTIPIKIVNIEEDDFKLLTKKRFAFNWKSIKKWLDIYKLQVFEDEEGEILGVMGLIDVPGDKRIEIKLLATSIENRGRNKIYDRVAGCLIAFACLASTRKYGNSACVSLVPKTNLIRHYMQKYHMQYAGRQLYIEGESLKELLNEYSL